MDMRRHIKGHQTPNMDTSKDFKEKPKPTSKHSKAHYIRNHLSCHNTFGSKAHSLGSKSGSKSHQRTSNTKYRYIKGFQRKTQTHKQTF